MLAFVGSKQIERVRKSKSKRETVLKRTCPFFNLYRSKLIYHVSAFEEVCMTNSHHVRALYICLIYSSIAHCN